MVLAIPTTEELRDEQECASDDTGHRDMNWGFKFKDSSNVEPADAHGA
ncbi:MAG: hypothetical protein V7603_3344 [Micromonosporaceae bacterium]